AQGAGESGRAPQGMPAPEQTPLVEEGLQQTSAEACTDPGREPESTATSILASVREQHELQFQRLTREPEAWSRIAEHCRHEVQTLTASSAYVPKLNTSFV
uniref:Uncharacterized protein n=1 Tax=Monodelphis domestica TaxID=13616 RepID=A0A5F8GFI1_MONDO